MKRDLAIHLCSRFGASLIQAVMFIVLGRMSAPAEFGIVSAIIGVATLASALSDFGAGTFVLKHSARKSDYTKVHSALRLNDGSTFLLVVSAGIAAYFLGATFGEFALIALFLFIWQMLEKYSDIRLNILLAQRFTGRSGFILLGRRLVSLTLFLAIVYFQLLNPIMSFACSLLASAILGAIVSSFASRRLIRRSSVGLSDIRGVAYSSLPYLVTNASAQLRNLDVAIVGLLAGGTQAGFYGAAVRLSNPVLMFATSVAAIALPRSVDRTPDELRLGIRRLTLFALAGIACLVLAGFAASPLMGLLFGADYAGAGSTLQILLVAYGAYGAVSALSGVLQAADMQRYVALGAMGGAVLMLALIIVGTIHAGAEGAASGVLAGAVVRYGWLLLGARRLGT